MAPVDQITQDQDRQAGERVAFLDVLKGLLSVGMIYGHVVCLLGVKELSPARALLGVLSVFTFPGFVFCFAYAAQLAYFGRPQRRSAPRLLVNAVRILVAFYVSAAAFRLLVTESPLGLPGLLSIITLSDVPPYSEFLLAFALYMLLAAALMAPLRALLERPRLFWVLVAALPLTAMIPYERVTSVHLGLLIGTARTPTFPVVQFAPYFLLGAFLARYRPRIGARATLIATACSSALAVSYAATGRIPGMYPPSLAWVLGAPLPLCLVYLVAQALAARRGMVVEMLQRFGRNVLFCLLASNLMLFALERVWPGHILQPREYLPLCAALLAIIYYLLIIVDRASRSSVPLAVAVPRATPAPASGTPSHGTQEGPRCAP